MKLGNVVKDMSKWNMQRAYLFEAFMPMIGDGNENEVSKRCLDVSFGLYSMDAPDMIKSGAFVSKFPSTQSIKDITLTFLETEDFMVHNYFKAWYEKIITPDGFFGIKSEYSRRVDIFFYKQDWSVAKQFICNACFPVGMPEYAPNYTEDKILQYSITLATEYVSDEARGSNNVVTAAGAARSGFSLSAVVGKVSPKWAARATQAVDVMTGIKSQGFGGYLGNVAKSYAKGFVDSKVSKLTGKVRSAVSGMSAKINKPFNNAINTVRAGTSKVFDLSKYTGGQ